MFVQGQAEIIEVIADSGMMMVNGNLTELDLPSGLLIAAIYRGGVVIIHECKRYTRNIASELFDKRGFRPRLLVYHPRTAVHRLLLIGDRCNALRVRRL